MNLKKTLLCVTAAALLAGSLAACSQKSVSSAQRTGYESAYDISYDDTGEISFESAMPVALNASGKSAAGFATYPFTPPDESATATSVPTAKLTWAVQSERVR